MVSIEKEEAHEFADGFCDERNVEMNLCKFVSHVAIVQFCMNRFD